MDLELSIAPLGISSNLFAAKAKVPLLDALSLAFDLNHLLDGFEELTGLRGQLVEGSSEDFMGEVIGRFNVIEGDFQIRQLSVATLEGFNGALVLMQQGDTVDQGEVFFMISAGTGFIR